MRFLAAGGEAFLVEVQDTGTAMRLYDEARLRAVDVRDVVPAARTVLFDGVADVPGLQREIATWDLGQRPRALANDRLVEVPTVYDGPDLPAVAARWDLSVPELVALHTSLEMVVAFCGFVPGFAYCTAEGLPGPVPRLGEPRIRVPAGSVAIADVFTGIYPTASPGGWHLLGRTDLVLWEDSGDPPATLAPGTRVRFVEVDR